MAGATTGASSAVGVRPPMCTLHLRIKPVFDNESWNARNTPDVPSYKRELIGKRDRGDAKVGLCQRRAGSFQVRFDLADHSSCGGRSNTTARALTIAAMSCSLVSQS